MTSTAFTPAPEPTKQGFTFKHILMATDFSEASARALAIEIRIGLRHGSELLFVHAVPPAPRASSPRSGAA